jgi:hypothetical protein
MASLTTAQELESIRAALQLFSQGQSTASVTIGDISLTYQSTQAQFLVDREKELLRRLSVRNVRKRTLPDFS